MGAVYSLLMLLLQELLGRGGISLSGERERRGWKGERDASAVKIGVEGLDSYGWKYRDRGEGGTVCMCGRERNEPLVRGRNERIDISL